MDNETVERVAKALYRRYNEAEFTMLPDRAKNVYRADARAALAAAEPAIRADQIKRDAAIARAVPDPDNGVDYDSPFSDGTECAAQDIESQNNE